MSADVLTLIWCLVLALGGACAWVFADAMQVLEARRQHKFAHPHHLYWGAGLILLPPLTAWVLAAWAVGLWWMADDAAQHDRQVREPAYRSPINVVWRRFAIWLGNRDWCPRWLRDLVWRCVLLAAAAAAAHHAPALPAQAAVPDAPPQAAPQRAVFVGIVAGQAADLWAADAQRATAYSAERAYCVKRTRLVAIATSSGARVVVLAVDSVARADSVRATPTVIARAVCRPDEPIAHSHGARCNVTATHCEFPERAADCGPSDADRAELERSGRPFGVVICSAELFAFYWPRRPMRAASRPPASRPLPSPGRS